MKKAQAYQGPLMIDCPHCDEAIELDGDPYEGAKETCWQCGKEFCAIGVDYNLETCGCGEDDV